MLIANARMYAVAPEAAAAWKDLFAWLSERAGVPLTVIEHAFPAPLSELWARPDLACAFMCGLPYLRARDRPKPVAAPIPAAGRNGGRPVYVTDLVVQAASPFRTLEDTFGGRLGYTVEDSHSGYNALRHHLLPFRQARASALYRDSVGPLHTPRNVIRALLAGEIDIGPADGYALDLMRRHDPTLDERIRIVATTDPAPIPFLVAGPGCPDETVAQLRAALLGFAEAPECADIAARLCLAGFAPVHLPDYALIAAWESEAQAQGYDRPA
ncbi:phosphate/phosphite/phosphonate ABC transporter substrate-binding protein [Arenibaculum pallidiluteum]|uniref:phosphate/phosphite/phosphonate ABC transporter substrate-binding protein n=1 Tax=Arenibaculum pallidiluteum TaxID=2812559 RepID=UPI001A96BDDE|nr:PhnD/SsuA/transferrin family substrate-binding protein [Arenibaculum pallidiluteum]